MKMNVFSAIKCIVTVLSTQFLLSFVGTSEWTIGICFSVSLDTKWNHTNQHPIREAYE